MCGSWGLGFQSVPPGRQIQDRENGTCGLCLISPVLPLSGGKKSQTSGESTGINTSANRIWDLEESSKYQRDESVVNKQEYLCDYL